jgi:hypothetical protein
VVDIYPGYIYLSTHELSCPGGCQYDNVWIDREIDIISNIISDKPTGAPIVNVR